MIKKKVLEKLKGTKLHILLRKLRMILHYKPTYHSTKDFIKHYIGGLLRRSREHHLFLFAGGLSFSLFFCTIPFVLIIFFVLGNVLDSATMQTQVNTLIEAIIPYSKYAEFVKSIIFNSIEEVVQYKRIAGIIGIFVLFFAASELFSSMRTILNKVFGVEININILLSKLRDLFLIILLLIIFTAITFSIPLIEVIRQSASNWNVLNRLFESGIFEQVFFSFLSLIVIFVSFGILYLTVPVKKISKKSALWGALWAAILWEIVKLGFGFYLHHFSNLGRIYGAYTLFIVVAFWIYCTSAVFIIGAEIARLHSDKIYMTDIID
ncbi:MAG TPA: YihY/virulence factor BrkB family protein [Ignavibacteriaceae bacterium]|nr:YihY/virulence factor BrkB family protein [Ignavibacteriaceae bacterium]